MITNLFTTSLAEAISFFGEREAAIRVRIQDIYHDVLRQSPHIRQPNFTSIHPRDLDLLFRAYDERFFGNHCRAALNGTRIRFRLSDE